MTQTAVTGFQLAIPISPGPPSGKTGVHGIAVHSQDGGYNDNSYGGYFGSQITNDLGSSTGDNYGILASDWGNAGSGASYAGYFGGNLAATGNIIAYVSDERVKKDLIQIGGALDKIKSMSGYNFTWNDLSTPTRRGTYDIGMIAQDVQKVLPEVIEEYNHSREEIKEGAFDTKKNGKLLNIQYQKLVPVLVEAVKEQQKQIEDLQQQVKEIKDGSTS